MHSFRHKVLFIILSFMRNFFSIFKKQDFGQSNPRHVTAIIRMGYKNNLKNIPAIKIVIIFFVIFALNK